jgi:hypothetical protein
MLRSSATLRCLPDSLGPVFDDIDFVPVDILADALVDLATADPEAGDDGKDQQHAHAAVFNLRNPHPVPWATVLPAVADALAAATPGQAVDVVAPATWLARLQQEAAAAKEADLEATTRRLPALKLLDFFQDLWSTTGTAPPTASMALERALAASPALSALGPVEPVWMRKWLAEWMAAWS